MLSEDGALEPRKGGYSIEPFVRIDGQTFSWADVTATQDLRDGYLPMPAVVWHAPKFELTIDSFARGTRESAQIVARYRLRNISDAEVAATR